MAYTVREACFHHGNWIIQYDLSARALTDSFGSSSGHYGQVVDILQNAGFVRVRYNVFRHRHGCYLQHAIQTVGIIRLLPWAG
ncbi:280_t:CDS:1, partial [Acaulospora morrowiae]